MARKILLADDSVTAQNMGRKILADAGYEVVAVNNGSAALKRISEQRPDLIVLDVYMPGYSGLEVCQRLKETNETARIPILLTVGKLEPFKPEEAKRVRADGFIVKPFEASELLSALTKLEDKIVPHSEGSKPGRFARAIAAVEEGRYDKNVASDEDSGWKSRINFPPKTKTKAKQPEPEDADDPAIYNPVNKDLRTVVERPSHKPQPANLEPEHSPEHSKVDLGALAPEGLPKDVTPEEIAALAAAAARVSGAVAETQAETKIHEMGDVKPGDGKASETAPVQPMPSETPSAGTYAQVGASAEAKADGKVEAQPVETVEAKPVEAELVESRLEVHAEPKSEPTSDARIESKSEAQAETKPDMTSEAAVAAQPAAEPPTSTFAPFAAAAQPETAPLEAAKEPPKEAAKEPALDTMAASTHESPSASRELPAGEPATMAVAVGAESAWPQARWTAVAVAIAPEEAALSLENEMQKAGAAFAAAAAQALSSAVPQPAPLAPEPAPVAQAATATFPAETASAEPAKFEPAPVAAAKTEVPGIDAAKLEQTKLEQIKLEEAKLEPAVIASENTEMPEPQPAAAEAPAPAAEPAPVPAAESTFAKVASFASEAVTVAVKAFEKITASQADAQPIPPEPGSLPAVSSPAAESVSQADAVSDSRTEETPAVAHASAHTELPRHETSAPEPAAQEKSAAEFPVSAEASYKAEPDATEQPWRGSDKIQQAEEAALLAPSALPGLAATSPDKQEVCDQPAVEISPDPIASTPAPAAASPVPEPAFADSVAAAAAAAQAYIARVTAAESVTAPFDSPIVGGTDDMAKRESETAATAAGAWASWRRIRDVGDKAPAPPEPDSGKGQVSAKEAAFERAEASSDKNQDKAAMAVAAGAEKAPEEVIPAAESDSGEIASIVDSVLADLRPKIVEEISRKLGKKK